MDSRMVSARCLCLTRKSSLTAYSFVNKSTTRFLVRCDKAADGASGSAFGVAQSQSAHHPPPPRPPPPSSATNIGDLFGLESGVGCVAQSNAGSSPLPGRATENFGTFDFLPMDSAGGVAPVSAAPCAPAGTGPAAAGEHASPAKHATQGFLPQSFVCFLFVHFTFLYVALALVIAHEATI